MENTTHSTLSKREEVERFKAAADRLARRAEKDPSFAEQLLRDLGYYEMMEQQRAEEAEEARNGIGGSASPAPATHGASRKAAPAKRRATKSKVAKRRAIKGKAAEAPR